MQGREVTGLKRRSIRHRDRISQVPIYLGKQFRFFINENDWKVLPMAAVIAALVAMVIRNKMFLNMEGGLIGAFSLTCVAIWNGCFNSIQSVCRERAIIKREHRSGMHISAYMAAHMIYQFFLCLLQTFVTVYVLKLLGVQFPQEGFITGSMIFDVSISMLLITYAADMMSLFISSISKTTTSAMTIMPFVLIFQLVFSGGIIPLPEWTQPISNFTISNYGINALCSQSGYNELPMVTTWKTIEGMKEKEINMTLTIGDVLTAMGIDEALDQIRQEKLMDPITVGEIIDAFGEDRVKNLVQNTTAEAARKEKYEATWQNVVRNWIMLAVFICAFAVLATIALELIDKDKR